MKSDLSSTKCPNCLYIAGFSVYQGIQRLHPGDETTYSVDEWEKYSDKLQKNATNLKKYRNITLVNDYLRFALKIFIYLGVLLRTPFDLQQLTNFSIYPGILILPVNNW